MKTRVSGCISIWKSQTQTGWWLSVQWGRGRGGVNGTSIRRTCTNSLRDRFLFIKHRHTDTRARVVQVERKEGGEILSLSLYSIHLSRAQHTGSRLLYNMNVFKWCRRQAASVQLLFTVRTGLCFFHSSSRNASGVFFLHFYDRANAIRYRPFSHLAKEEKKNSSWCRVVSLVCGPPVTDGRVSSSWIDFVCIFS